MADLEKLTVLLEAQTKQFENAMKRVQRLTGETASKTEKSLSRLDKALGRTNAAVANFAKGFAGAFTVGAAVQGLDQLVKKFAEIKDNADRAGVSAEFLQSLNIAGLGAGASEMTDLLQKFNLEIGEAATQGGKLAELLQANGVAIRNANGELRSTQELFFEVANLIHRAGSLQEAMTISNIAFGKSSKDSVVFLRQGADEIQRGMQAAKDTGAVLREEIVVEFDRLADSMTVAFQTISVIIATEIMPVIREVSAFYSKVDALVKKYGPFSSVGPNISQFDLMTTRNDKNVTQFDLMMMNAKRPAGQTTVMPQLGGGSGGTTTKQTTQEIIDLTNSSADYIAVAQKMSEQVMAVEDAFVGFFTSLVNGTKPIDALRNSLSQLGGSLLKLGLTKGFEILVGALAGGGGFTNSGLGSSIQMGGLYAAGGAIKGNTANIVGENGPELFVPGSSGYVVPNNRLGGSGGGTTVNVVNQGGIESTQRRSTSGGREIIEIVNRVVEGRFPDLLNRNAPLIGGRPIAKRTV